MQITLDCIALRVVRHTDRHSILSVFTRQRGRMSFIINASGGREAARRRAIFMPGSRFSCVADVKDGTPGNQLPHIKDVMSRGTHPAAGGNPVKSAVTLFIADFLGMLLRDYPADELLYDFCDSMFSSYNDIKTGDSNFHLMFMIRMMHFVGIEPDASTYREGRVFDMVDGVFRESAPLHGRFLQREESQVAFRLMTMNIRNLRLWKFNSVQRNTILDRLIEYYGLHYASLHSMKSLDVLRSIF